MIANNFFLTVALILMVPLASRAQDLDFYYSPSRGTVVIDYNYHCDPCIFGQEVTEICDCEKECQGTFDACTAACQEMTDDLVEFELCLDRCTETYNYCRSSCGFRPKEVKRLSHFTIAIDSYYAPVGQNPYLNRESIQGTYARVNTLTELKNFRWRPPLLPWPNVFYTHNTC
ncbi:MAG: hypothetical protein KDC24_11715, partial [Saprospiraceae bacterium]|nr:hypothetical protein [Saprospiraceae bacterium]